MIVDTSAILAFVDRDEPDHDALIALLSTPVYNSACVDFRFTARHTATNEHLSSRQQDRVQMETLVRNASGPRRSPARNGLAQVDHMGSIIARYHDARTIGILRQER